MKRAVITGITGQDGAYLSRLLLKKNYEIVGVIRNKSSIYRLKYLGIDKMLTYENCNLLDNREIVSLLRKYSPDEIYNLAAQSSVAQSFISPSDTINFNIISVLNILEAIRTENTEIRYYQASSSEMYGSVNLLPITENTAMHPVSPYGISKAAAHWITQNYRDNYGIFACCGILFNHESYLRDNSYFIKKVILEAIKIKNGQKDRLIVGNIDVKRDFGYSPLYVEAMWKMLQNEKPDDYIICSGKSYLLRDLIYHIFNYLDIDKRKLFIDSNLFRPKEILDIYGDNSKARNELKWNYDCDFFEIVNILIEEEIKNIE
jgi:GDPmannose 4,6-dehydratase